MRTLVIVFASLLIAGCSSEPAGPTYAEAVATYQAEVALLDSLLAKRKAIEDEYLASVESLRKDVSFSYEHEGAVRDARGKVGSMTLEQVEDVLLSDDTRDIGRTAEKWVATRRSRMLRNLQEIEPLVSRQSELVEKANETRDRLSVAQ